MFKKTLSLLLALAMLICLLPQIPLIANAYTPGTERRSGDWTFEIGWYGDAYLKKYHGSASNVTIPTKLGGWNISGMKAGVFTGNTTVKNIVVPNGIGSISDEAFKGCAYIETIKLPSNITLGTYSTFEGCTKLKSVNLPNNLEEIGYHMFRFCSSLSSLTLPSSVGSIETYAFYGCTSLTSLHLGKWVDSIGYQAFSFCTALREFTVDSQNNYFSTDDNGVLFNKNHTTLYAYPGGRTGSYTVPASVAQVAHYAFEGASGLTEVSFESDDTVINAHNFAYCTSLVSAEIPAAAKTLYYTFQGCISLESISIPDGTNAFVHSFEDCYSLREIRFEGACSIASDAFTNVTATAYYPVDNPDWSETKLRDYGGSLTWVPYCSGVYHVVEWENTVTEPTCTAPGMIEGVCTMCGYYTKELPMVPHKYQYETIEEPTCTSTGLQQGTCTECGHIVNNTLAKLPHNGYGAQPIYQEGRGNHTYNCINCGYVINTEWCTKSTPVTIREATLTQIGLDQSECTVCGHTFLDGIPYRIKGSSRYETSLAIAEELKQLQQVDQFQSVILASGTNFPDALAGSYLAIEKNAPILLVNEANPDSIITYVTENLAPGGTAYILGGSAAVSEAVEHSLIEAQISTQRISGANRYQTNLAILQEAGMDTETILVCTGTNFADSLSASACGMPILLVNPSTSTLSQEQTDFLTELTAQGALNFCIIGGKGAVPEKYETLLAAFGGTVTRINGSSREETSRKFAVDFCSESTGAALTNSQNFPDGLCGGPLAYQLGIPLLLVNQGAYDPAIDYIKSRDSVTVGILFGGTAAVNEGPARNIFRNIE